MAAVASAPGPPEPVAEAAMVAETELARNHNLRIEFFSEGFDAVRSVLEDLPADYAWTEPAAADAMEEKAMALETALDKVSTKLSGRVTASYSKFVQGMAGIHEIGVDMETTTIICRNGRHNLGAARDLLKHGGLGIAENTHKKAELVSTFQMLQAMSELLDAYENTILCIHAKNFVGALTMARAGRSLAANLSQVACVADIAKMFEETTRKIENEVKFFFRDSLSSFSAAEYAAALLCYRLIGDPSRFYDSLPKAISESVRADAIDAVKDALERRARVQGRPFQLIGVFDPPDSQRVSFSKLCGVVELDAFVDTLRHLCAKMTDLLANFNRVLAWHSERARTSDDDSAYFHEVGERIRALTPKLWEHVSGRVSNMLHAAARLSFSLDAFYDVALLSSRMAALGEAFTGCDAGLLRNDLALLSERYFEGQHVRSLDYLRTLLENDSWFAVPVGVGYGPADLRFPSPDSAAAVTTPPALATGDALLAEYAVSGSPIMLIPLRSIQTVAAAPHQTGAAAAAAAAAAGHATAAATAKGAVPEAAPLVSNATVTTLKTAAGYCSILAVLPSATRAVLEGLAQLVEYYVYSVYAFFGAWNEPLDAHPHVSTRVRALLGRLQYWVEGGEHAGGPGIGGGAAAVGADSAEGMAAAAAAAALAGGHARSSVRPRATPAVISSMVSLESPTSLFGLATRVVGIESLGFIARVFDQMHAWLSAVVAHDRAHVAQLREFFATLDCLPELCTAMYRTIGSHLFHSEPAVASAAAAKWDLKDVPSSHSAYVGILVAEIGQLNGRLASQPPGMITEPVRASLWQAIIGTVMAFMLDTFAGARKCSTEGRAQMQFDLSTLASSLKRASGQNPLPGEIKVQAFINAFYLQDEGEIIAWMTEHTEYSGKQLTALLNAATALTKKGKAKAQEIIDAREPKGTKKRTLMASLTGFGRG